jgi:HAD superfamily hydrolase (TIGR01509 family)
MYRHIIWDFDGTLLNTYPAINKAFQDALISLGASEDLSYIAELSLISLGHCLKALADKHAVSEEELEAQFHEHYNSMGPETQKPYPGVPDICRAIVQRGGSNFVFTHRGTGSMMRLLKAHRLDEYFEECLSVDQGYPKKPDPQAFLHLIETHGLERDQVLAVGDRELDVKAGQAAGIAACLFVESGDTTISADYTICSYVKLTQILGL